MRRALFLAAILVATAGCRILSGEVACERDRDCPASVRFCDSEANLCVDEDPDPEPPDEPFVIPFPDAGPGDAGPDAGG